MINYKLNFRDHIIIVNFSFCLVRLLDAVACDGRHGREMVLHMVFEYMDQDLDSFIRRRRPFGLETELMKVYIIIMNMFIY